MGDTHVQHEDAHTPAGQYTETDIEEVLSHTESAAVILSSHRCKQVVQRMLQDMLGRALDDRARYNCGNRILGTVHRFWYRGGLLNNMLRRNDDGHRISLRYTSVHRGFPFCKSDGTGFCECSSHSDKGRQ